MLSPARTCTPGLDSSNWIYVTWCVTRVNSVGGSSMKGTVKWFNDSKGYGFIQQNEGEVVEFEILESETGRQAAQVMRD